MIILFFLEITTENSLKMNNKILELTKISSKYYKQNLSNGQDKNVDI